MCILANVQEVCYHERKGGEREQGKEREVKGKQRPRNVDLRQE